MLSVVRGTGHRGAYEHGATRLPAPLPIHGRTQAHVLYLPRAREPPSGCELMAGYYRSDERGFQLFRRVGAPAWRPPQLAALGAALSQWSLAGEDSPLISVPTGVGKTAVALAAPFVAGASRVLVVVPTRELRRQTAEQFKTQGVLRRIGALREEGVTQPHVLEVEGRSTDWKRLLEADVVVGIPASVSPVHYVDSPPPPDLFDLVIVDEAHHAPAATWSAILSHFEAQHLLLTATPQRRDRKRLPGKLVYYYPLRQAIDDRLYQPVDPRVIEIDEGATKDKIDRLIVEAVDAVLKRPEHKTSQMLIRAGTKRRAHELAALYKAAGHEAPVLHSGLGRARQRAVIEGLRKGDHRGVVMVGMLVEGFDLPSLRIAAYHDKHKSLEPTAQLIGRLARVDPRYPQRSTLVTARDADVYPYLQGVVRSLYAEDSDWAVVLPGIIDAFVEDDLKDRSYARLFAPSTGQVEVAHIHPLRRARILEVRADVPWVPSFLEGQVPDELAVGELFAGQRILYSGTNPDHTTLLMVTGQPVRPRWNSGDALDSVEYDLHLLTYRRAPQVDQPDLVLVNTARSSAQRKLVSAIGGDDALRPGDARRVQLAFDSLPRISVSSVGVRSTYGPTRGSPSYRMFAGSSIESGLRDSDTAQSALGHAMVQVSGDAGAFTAGVSTGKSKYWETRYTPLRMYEDFASDLAARYWYPPIAPSGPLLPQINRGRSLLVWPQAKVLAVALDYALLGAEWSLDEHGSLDLIDMVGGDAALHRGAPPPSGDDWLPLAAIAPSPSGETVIWTGEIDCFGTVTPTQPEITVRRGHSNPTLLSDLLTDRPPTVFFLDGSTVRGRELFPPSGVMRSLPSELILTRDWQGVDITAETRAKATAKGAGASVHESLEVFLREQAPRGRRRWILSNDGAGEIADYIVIETLPTGQVAVDLWHAKFAGGASPSVRVTDFEVVTAQAVKSRRWPTDRQLWDQLAARLSGRSHPEAILVEGNRRQLEVLLGLHTRWATMSLTRRKPSVVGGIGIAQPGLSRAQLDLDLGVGATSALQIVQLLSVFRDAVLSVAQPKILVSP